MRRVGAAVTAVAVGTAVFIALFPLYWAVVTSLRPRNAELGDLWLPGVTFDPTLAAWERLLALPGLWSSLPYHRINNGTAMPMVGRFWRDMMAADCRDDACKRVARATPQRRDGPP